MEMGRLGLRRNIGMVFEWEITGTGWDGVPSDGRTATGT